MDTSCLEDIGLTKSEISTYTALLSLGNAKVGAIIEKTNLASSAAHNSLHSLRAKGLVAFIKKGHVTHYHAVSPKEIAKYFEEKKNALMQVIPILEAKQKPIENQEAEVFEGNRGLMAMLHTLIEDSKPGEEYLFFSVDVDDQNQEIQDFFRKYDEERNDKRLIVKGIGREEIQRIFKKRKNLSLRFTTLPIPKGLTIFKNKLCLFSWEEKPVGYLIKSPQLATAYTKLFNEIWAKSEKTKTFK
jgi:sugar-specific transcriptional regulator TrmB